MNNATTALWWIKAVHTVIWSLYVLVIGYILYAGIKNLINSRVWIAIGLVVFEGAVLMAFGWRCPLTVLAYRYTDNRAANFDIFLPNWLAANNKTIFTTIFMAGVLLVAYRVATNRKSSRR